MKCVDCKKIVRTISSRTGLCEACLKQLIEDHTWSEAQADQSRENRSEHAE